MKRHILVFLTVLALDLAFAFYILETADKAPLTAGGWAAIIQACNAYLVVSFVQDRTLVLSAMAGAFLGTWAAITFVL